MSKRREPVAALEASGSRHYSKSDLAERKESEVPAPAAAPAPPDYLPASLVENFGRIAGILAAAGMMTELDSGSLARYLIAERDYLRATNRLNNAINTGNTADASAWSAMQDRFFRQCRMSAGDLGLTVSGRCRLLLPPAAGGGSEGADLYGDD